MRTERFNEQQQLGLLKLTGDNTGLVYTNERTEEEPLVMEDGSESEETRTVYIYDIYEVGDARDPHKVKNDVINGEHPYGDELKILRKTIRKMLTAKQYNSEDFSEFKAYNEFAEVL